MPTFSNFNEFYESELPRTGNYVIRKSSDGCHLLLPDGEKQALRRIPKTEFAEISVFSPTSRMLILYIKICLHQKRGEPVFIGIPFELYGDEFSGKDNGKELTLSVWTRTGQQGQLPAGVTYFG